MQHAFIRKLWRYALAVLAAGAVSACGMPQPVSDRKITAQIPRQTLTLPDGTQVSYLQSLRTGGWRVIYVHGTPGEARQWVDYLASPGAGMSAIAVDRPGFGQSGPATVSLKNQAAALAPLLVETDGRWPVLVGHSLGGPIVAQAAADYPGRIAGLVIAAGSLDPNLEEIHWLQPLGEIWPFRSLLPSAIQNANRELLALKGELEDLNARLAAIQVPIVIVHGTKDDLVPFANVAYMRRMFSKNPNVVIVPLEGVNHFLPWNSMDAIRQATGKVMALASAGKQAGVSAP